jgi:predicted AlkP superfamily pyrophosphatase or phosphodiesterase
MGRKMSVVGRLGVFVLLGMTSACQQTPDGASADPPTLAILMVIDQLRPDLLDRYDHLFVGGLRRLLDEGYHFENATHDHAVTTTGPGHTTLATGVYPTRHGIVGNAWFESIEGERRSVYSMEDRNSPILGYPELTGRSSANIERPGLPDWISDHDPSSRVVSISRKDRAAIGLAAQAVGEVYWIEERGGEFVTSDFYHSAYPDWITEFNATTMPLVYSDTVWESSIPPEARSLTRPDTSRWELEGEHTAFPHVASELVDASDPRELNHWRWRYTPFPDRAVVSLAVEAVQEFQLGQRGSVDYLGIALSQTDGVGHHFGPLSREQLDNLLRLDLELDRFFSFLDDSVGPGRWVVAVSADHGVLDIPEHLFERGVDARRLSRGDRAEVRAYIQDALDGLGEDEAPEEAVKEALATLPYVAAAYTFSEVESGLPSDSFQVFFAHSHSRVRQVGPTAQIGVYVRYERNVHTSGASQASHSTPYYYDRHVPLIFFGGGIRPGVTDQRVATVDVAPTLAWIVGTPAPDDLDGRVLESVLSH